VIQEVLQVNHAGVPAALAVFFGPSPAAGNFDARCIRTGGKPVAHFSGQLAQFRVQGSYLRQLNGGEGQALAVIGSGGIGREIGVDYGLAEVEGADGRLRLGGAQPSLVVPSASRLQLLGSHHVVGEG